jgi:hypothetical protein
MNLNLLSKRELEVVRGLCEGLTQPRNRRSFQSETDRQISIWVHLAFTRTLSTFGTEKEMHAAMEQSFLLFKSNCGEASDNAADA